MLPLYLAVPVLLFFLPFVFDHFFNPKRVQERKHSRIDWSYKLIELPHQNPSGKQYVFGREIKYNIEKDKFFRRNLMPGPHITKKWKEIESKELKKHIKKQISS